MAPEMKFGLEHEVGLVGKSGWLDFGNLSQLDLEAVIAGLPYYDADYPGLRQGNVGIKVKRWYIEGLERFNDRGGFVGITPKGIEIRTPIVDSIAAAVRSVESDRRLLVGAVRERGWAVRETGFSPFRTDFSPEPPLNAYERADTEMTQVETAGTYMLTYGPDVNLSVAGWTDAQVVDAARKLVHYSPFLVPFSFSSPFYDGKLWNGYSVRTWYRSATRPAALAYISPRAVDNYPGAPVHTARIPAEHGRIEYKAFDTVSSPGLYHSLMALVKGVVLDDSLDARADTADVGLHRLAATSGFDDGFVANGSHQVLTAARQALGSDEDGGYLDLLESMLHDRRTPAHDLIAGYNKTNDILKTLEDADGWKV